MNQWTAYCQKHASLELVGDVTSVSTFMVERRGLLGTPERTGRSACEVRAITASGCKVHFIGGPQWTQ